MKVVLTTLLFAVAVAATAQAQLFTSITAKELLPQVTAQAQEDLANDAQLINVLFAGITTTTVSLEMDINSGKATGWVYRYYSPSLDSGYLLVGMKTIAGPMIFPPPTGTMPPVPFDEKVVLSDPWVDSPAALNGAKTGGADFFTAHPSAKVLLAALFENPFETPIAPAGKFWFFRFGDDSDTLTCFVNAETGVSFTCGSISDVQGIPEAQGFRLDAGYPNPFQLSAGGAARIGYALASSSNIRMTLHDALGRTLSVLAEGVQSAGEYTASIPASMIPSPGVYMYRIETPRGTQSGKLVVR